MDGIDNMEENSIPYTTANKLVQFEVQRKQHLNLFFICVASVNYLQCSIHTVYNL
jgi:hypothetical protein